MIDLLSATNKEDHIMKITNFAVAAVLSVGVFTTSSIAEQLSMAFIVKDMNNPYYARMGEGALRAADEKGIKLSYVAAEFNGDIEGQIGVVEAELVKNHDAIVLVPMNGTALIPKVMEANSLGIPVITADTKVEDGPGKVETFVGLDERSSFTGMAQWVVDQLGGEGQVAILEGFRGSSTAELRLLGMMDVFDAYDGIEVVASIAADWDQEKGLKVAEDILQSHPEVDAFVGTNDLMALGAVQAVKGAGKSDSIIVVGDDAIPSALASLRAGDLDATIDGNTDLVGYEAVMAAYRHVTNGEDLDDWIKVESSIMTAEDVTDDYLEGRGIELK